MGGGQAKALGWERKVIQQAPLQHVSKERRGGAGISGHPPVMSFSLWSFGVAVITPASQVPRAPGQGQIELSVKPGSQPLDLDEPRQRGRAGT